MPVPSVQLYLYGSTDLFEKGLIEVGGVTTDQARVIARANSALAAARTWSILVNATLRRRLEGQMAHEFMHLMQSGWSERRNDRRGPQWIREGMAVYYESKTEDVLKIRAFNVIEQSAVEAVRGRIDTLVALPLGMDFDLYVRLNGTLGRASNGWAIFTHGLSSRTLALRQRLRRTRLCGSLRFPTSAPISRLRSKTRFK